MRIVIAVCLASALVGAACKKRPPPRVIGVPYGAVLICGYERDRVQQCVAGGKAYLCVNAITDGAFALHCAPGVAPMVPAAEAQ